MTTAASPLGCEEVFMGGRSPGELCLSPAAAARVHSTVMRFPVGPLHHATPKQDGVSTVLQRDSRLGAHNRQGERTRHPPTQDRGLSGPCSVKASISPAMAGSDGQQCRSRPPSNISLRSTSSRPRLDGHVPITVRSFTLRQEEVCGKGM